MLQRWQENIHAQITIIGYVQNNFDYSFYTKHDKNNEVEALLYITVDDFLLSYRDESTQQNFYNHSSSAFNITTPSNITKLNFLSLAIYQSNFGTNIDQTNHIQCKIIAPWFTNSHFPKFTNSPFPTDTNFELDLSQASPLEGDELNSYKPRYQGIFNHSISKIIHIQQWICMDINYAATCLASFTQNPNKPAFTLIQN